MAKSKFKIGFIEGIKKLLKQKIPTNMRESLQKRLNFAGDTQSPEDWIFNNVILTFFFSLLFSPIAYYFPAEFSQRIPINLFPFLTLGVFAALLFFFFLLAYLSIYYKMEGRRRKTEKILPDFLSVVAMNIDAGMEPLSALYVSLRPDFDPVASEMSKLRSLALGRKSLIDQLSLLTKTIDARALRNTISILERASLSGGDLARLLESLSSDLRETNRLQKELEASTRGYVYFLVFLVLFGIPFLLGVSAVFIDITSTTFASPFGFTTALSSFGGTASAPKEATNISENLDLIFVSLLLFNSISASLIYGVLLRGEVKYGTRFIPLLMMVSVLVFFVLRGAVSGVFSTLGLS